MSDKQPPSDTPPQDSSARHKLLLGCGICVGTAGQILMKLGVTALGGISLAGSPLTELWRVFTSPYIFAGLVCTALSMALWLTVISRLELSFAYPFVALSYVLVTIYGWAALSERVGALRVGGVVCIMIGVVVMSRTERRQDVT